MQNRVGLGSAIFQARGSQPGVHLPVWRGTF